MENNIYAKKIITILGKQPNVSNGVACRLEKSRKFAVLNKKNKVESIDFMVFSKNLFEKFLDWVSPRHVVSFVATALFVSTVLIVADNKNQDIYEESMNTISDYTTVSDIFDINFDEFDFSDEGEST